MPNTPTSLSRSQTELLMNVASTLADFTESAEQCANIPDYLSRVLDLEPITLAVIRSGNGDRDPQITFIRSSDQIATGEAAATFNQNILELYRQTKPLGPTEAPMLRHAFSIGHTNEGFTDLAMESLVTFPRALVFSRTIDDEHRMILIVHHRSENSLSPTATEILLLVAGQLGKLLKCMVSWQDHPDILGGPFNRLTEREWTVLRALNSDEGEKQLADRLDLSPHTLHSHIKSIYRKIGVQGRLPLLLRLNQALRELRTATVNRRALTSPAVPAESHVGDRLVAVG